MSRLDYEQMEIAEKAEIQMMKEEHERWLERMNAHRKFVTTPEDQSDSDDDGPGEETEAERQKKEDDEKENKRLQDEEDEKRKEEELEEESRKAGMESMVSKKEEDWTSFICPQEAVLAAIECSGRTSRAVSKFNETEKKNRERAASLNTVNKNRDLRKQIIVNTTDYDLKREKIRKNYAKLENLEPKLINANDGNCKILHLSPLDYYDFMCVTEVVHDKPELLQTMVGRIEAAEPVALWTDAKKLPVVVRMKFRFLPITQLSIRMEKNGVKKMNASVHAYPTTTKIMAQGNPETCLAFFLTIASHLLQWNKTTDLGCKIWKLGCSALRDLYPRQLTGLDNFVSPTKFERLKQHMGSIDEGVGALAVKQLLEHQSLRHTAVTYHPLEINTLRSSGKPEVDTKFHSKTEKMAHLRAIQEDGASPELPDKMGAKKNSVVNKIKKGVFSLISDPFKEDEPPVSLNIKDPSAPAWEEETTTIRLVERRTNILNQPEPQLENSALCQNPLAEAAVTALALGPLAKGGAMMELGVDLIKSVGETVGIPRDSGLYPNDMLREMREQVVTDARSLFGCNSNGLDEKTDDGCVRDGEEHEEQADSGTEDVVNDLPVLDEKTGDGCVDNRDGEEHEGQSDSGPDDVVNAIPVLGMNQPGKCGMEDNNSPVDECMVMGESVADGSVATMDKETGPPPTATGSSVAPHVIITSSPVTPSVTVTSSPTTPQFTETITTNTKFVHSEQQYYNESFSTFSGTGHVNLRLDDEDMCSSSFGESQEDDDDATRRPVYTIQGADGYYYRVFVAYHGTDHLNDILKEGPRLGDGKNLLSDERFPALYMSTDYEKTRNYGTGCLKLLFWAGKVKKVTDLNDPVRLTWARDFDSAWIPPNTMMNVIKSGRQENAIRSISQIEILGVCRGFEDLAPEIQALTADKSGRITTDLEPDDLPKLKTLIQRWTNDDAWGGNVSLDRDDLRVMRVLSDTREEVLDKLELAEANIVNGLKEKTNQLCKKIANVELQNTRMLTQFETLQRNMENKTTLAIQEEDKNQKNIDDKLEEQRKLLEKLIERGSAKEEDKNQKNIDDKLQEQRKLLEKIIERGPAKEEDDVLEKVSKILDERELTGDLIRSCIREEMRAALESEEQRRRTEHEKVMTNIGYLSTGISQVQKGISDIKERIQTIDDRSKQAKQKVNEIVASLGVKTTPLSENLDNLKGFVVEKLTEVVDIVAKNDEGKVIRDTSVKVEEIGKKIQGIENDLVNISDASISNYLNPKTPKKRTATQEKLLKMAEPPRQGKKWNKDECKNNGLEFDFDRSETGYLPIYNCCKCKEDFHGQTALIKHCKEKKCNTAEVEKMKVNLKKSLAKLGYGVIEPDFSRQDQREMKRIFLYIAKSKMKNLEVKNMFLSTPEKEWNEKLKTYVSKLAEQGIVTLSDDESANPHHNLVRILDKMTTAQIEFERAESKVGKPKNKTPPGPTKPPAEEPNVTSPCPPPPAVSSPKPAIPKSFGIPPFIPQPTSPPPSVSQQQTAMPRCPFCRLYAINLDMLTMHLDVCDQRRRTVQNNPQMFMPPLASKMQVPLFQ